MMSFWYESYDGVGGSSDHFYAAGLAEYDTTCNTSDLGMCE